MSEQKALKPWQQKVHEIIFEADTKHGKLFDVALIICIILSVIAVMLESVDAIDLEYADALNAVEWFFTIIFTIEYFLRIACVLKPKKYIFSFFGMVDLLSIIPTYLSLIYAGSHYLIVIRTLRIMRVFRVLKLAHYLSEANVLSQALIASRRKVTIFLSSVLILVCILGSLMYVIEGSANSGFTSIPRSIYWAIVTLTTVGYGDISPQTNLGQALASVVMIMGYAILAVPTGIVSVELAEATKSQHEITTQACPACMKEGHDKDAVHCKYCGQELNA